MTRIPVPPPKGIKKPSPPPPPPPIRKYVEGVGLANQKEIDDYNRKMIGGNRL